MSKRKSVGKPAADSRDPERTKQAILEAAVVEFSRDGLNGARVDAIVKKAKVNKRMVYHYFGNKEGLYQTVIEHVYQNIWDSANRVKINDVPPTQGVKRLVRFVWKNYRDNPDLLRLFHEENVHKAKHIQKSEKMKNISPGFMSNISLLVHRGISSGDFSVEITAAHLYTTILSMCYFYLSHQYTLTVFLGSNFQSAAAHKRWVQHVENVVVCYLKNGNKL